MRAALIETFKKPLVVSNVDEPQCPADGVIVGVKACGVCRSDWHAWTGADPDVSAPHVPGHEFAGVVTEVGRDCRRFKLGDRVTAPFILTRYCLPLLKRSSDPSIVFTSSGVVARPRAYWGAYLASKWASDGLMHMLADELTHMTDLLASSANPRGAANAILRFGDLIRVTPSLRAYQSDMMDQFVSVVAGILAARAGLSVDDPEPQIAARALLGLWHIQAESLRRHLAAKSLDGIHQKVTADVSRAALLIGAGLNSVTL